MRIHLVIEVRLNHFFETDLTITTLMSVVTRAHIVPRPEKRRQLLGLDSHCLATPDFTELRLRNAKIT